MYVCAPCACRTHKEQKRISNPLGLELQMVLSHPCGCWEFNQSPLGRADSALNYRSIPPVPSDIVLMCIGCELMPLELT